MVIAAWSKEGLGITAQPLFGFTQKRLEQEGDAHESGQVAQAMHALRGAVGTSTNRDDLELIGEGFSSLILALGNTVFRLRVPRHREAADRRAAVVRVLPELQPLLPIPIPVPIATAPPAASFPSAR